MNKPAALYARVSSNRQKENHTIASQVAALTQFAETTDTWSRPSGSSRMMVIVAPLWSVLV